MTWPALLRPAAVVEGSVPGLVDAPGNDQPAAKFATVFIHSKVLATAAALNGLGAGATARHRPDGWM